MTSRSRKASACEKSMRGWGPTRYVPRAAKGEETLLNLSNRAIYHARAIQSLIVPNSERLRHLKTAIAALEKIKASIGRAE